MAPRVKYSHRTWPSTPHCSTRNNGVNELPAESIADMQVSQHREHGPTESMAPTDLNTLGISPLIGPDAPNAPTLPSTNVTSSELAHVCSESDLSTSNYTRNPNMHRSALTALFACQQGPSAATQAAASFDQTARARTPDRFAREDADANNPGSPHSHSVTDGNDPTLHPRPPPHLAENYPHHSHEDVESLHRENLPDLTFAETGVGPANALLSHPAMSFNNILSEYGYGYGYDVLRPDGDTFFVMKTPPDRNAPTIWDTGSLSDSPPQATHAQLSLSDRIVHEEPVMHREQEAIPDGMDEWVGEVVDETQLAE
ncbi:uncharacterized protein N7482_007899 [Penicillium canariense]|uniref:Uncharacterized protein n=1 Tax=Penicillium canariense TaxID=189055 RepID=A0A9W9LK98_9EURO|nr:uncharacterized protein N7482_007899 [Penicillium canariense]KAJ5160895.1 hypothetical protein N7482_007899 [Penicillium canariense]